MAASESDKPRLEEELISLLRKHAYAVSWLLLRERNHDIVQTGVFQALRFAHTFKGESKFSTWFHRIVENLCLTEITRRKREVPLEAAPEPSVTPSLEKKIALSELTSELNSLDQQIVQMKREGRKEVEIAAELGMSRKAICSRWLRLKEKMLARLESD